MQYPPVTELTGQDVTHVLDTLDAHLAQAPLDVDLVYMSTSPRVFKQGGLMVELSRQMLSSYAKMPTPYATLTAKPFRSFVNPVFKDALCAALTHLCGYPVVPSVYPDIVCQTTRTIAAENLYAALVRVGAGDGDIVYYAFVLVLCVILTCFGLVV